MTFCDALLSVAIGVGTGALSSWLVSRRFSHDSHIDRALIALKFCSPYVARHPGGIGLKQTAHDLKAFSEILRRTKYSATAASALLDLSREIEDTPELGESAPETEKRARDALKAEWENRVFRLYHRK